jgi:hypothetical protein
MSARQKQKLSINSERVPGQRIIPESSAGNLACISEAQQSLI